MFSIPPYPEEKQQGNYAIDFRTLAAKSTWNTGSLFGAFLNGLSEEIKDELATRELPATLKALIFLAIRMDSRLRERERERKELLGGKLQALLFSPLSQQPGSAGGLSFREFPRSPEVLRERTEAVQPEPMQLGRAKMSPAERQQRISRCLRSAQPTLTELAGGVQGAVDLSAVPKEYMGLQEVFSKSRALSLPPHRPYDCAITLMTGKLPPSGRIYCLSGPETKAMEAYINSGE
ncbi:hypothetical protein DPEC_G00096480 [Dallia pectoralis]|uniref:Uncharacterized protein n=1 Tax=Dallia pectoralis TaxID=75939 RepID=A0ACC2GVE6_DALPE|nr:hypothetical protein DPEC_G00096480 [Dallia pectoralis]